MAGENAALWEVQSGAGNGTESTATTTHTQLFNDTGKVIGAPGAYITDISVSIRRAVPENEAVNDDNNEIQDMGLEGVDIIITGIAGKIATEATVNLVTKFNKWITDGNTTSGYQKGRFGLRLDNAPHWNVVPNGDANSAGTNYGFHIRNIDYKYVGERKNLVEFTIALALGGDITNAL